MRTITTCLSPKMDLYQTHLFVKYKLTTGISSVCGVNLTSYDTDWRQPCNTCIEAFLIKTLLIISNFLNFIIFIQGLVRFYADYRIKQHASLRLLRDRLIFLFSILQSYSQGGMVNALTSKPVIKLTTTIHRLQWGVHGSLILFPILTFVSQRQSLVDNCLRH